MERVETQVVYWKCIYDDILIEKDKSATKSDLINHIRSTHLEVRPEHKMAGNTTSLDSFQRIQQQISEHVDLEKRHTDLERSHTTVLERLAVLEDFKKGKSHVDLEKRHTDLEKRHTDLEKRHTDLGKRHTDLGKSHVDLGKSHVDLGKSHVDLEKRHTTVQERLAVLEDFKKGIRIPELLRYLRIARWIDHFERNELVHGADLSFDLKLIRSLSSQESTFLSHYELDYGDVCDAFEKRYGKKFEEFPEIIPEEMVSVFNMMSNLEHMDYWKVDDDVRKKRRKNLRKQCRQLINKGFTQNDYSKQQIREKWRHIKKAYERRS